MTRQFELVGIANNRLILEEVIPKPRARQRGTKREMIERMMQRRQGATRAEILAAAKWDAINVLTYGPKRVDRSSRPYRYFA